MQSLFISLLFPASSSESKKGLNRDHENWHSSTQPHVNDVQDYFDSYFTPRSLLTFLLHLGIIFDSMQVQPQLCNRAQPHTFIFDDFIVPQHRGACSPANLSIAALINY
jgi:hypothetical protein